MTAPISETPASEPARTAPAWITDPDLIASIETGLMTIDDLTGDPNA